MDGHGTLRLSQSGPVLTVSLNRPEVRNAFNAEMIADLTGVFSGVSARSGVRVVVLRGEGRSFSAGADINWMRASLDFTTDENVADAGRMSDMFAAIDDCPLPVVARVHGAALGGGMGLIAVCDIVVAEEGTIFGFTEAKLGILPAVISRFTLPKIGPSWARALYLTGERFGPDLARLIGLVHWTAAAEDLDQVVESRVNDLLTSGPEAVAAAKTLITECHGLDDADMREVTVRRIAERRASAEGQEGLRAFLEKRPATWTE
ncbi:MAG TPA: enoyl-CoA hydratase-related protein [Chloroflexota bacterium]|nr:enoyl-CoA hydratase-related protein [Chloroflexota bacterium]